jgi:hypothetical protein
MEVQMHSQENFNTQQAAEPYGLSESWLSKLRIFGDGSPHLKAGRSRPDHDKLAGTIHDASRANIDLKFARHGSEL